MQDITLEIANRAINAAVRKSQKMNVKQNIAIVDRGGNLKAFARMDGAWLGSIDIAVKKARTARLFELETGDIGKMSKPNGPLYGIELSNGGLISFPGGIPLTNEDGEVVGAIGVSGGTVKEDQAVAEDGADAVADLLERRAAA
ncbi:MAG TPA: heme-binding protein [Terriglobales bacterium]|nr:heme-binding protein [Terriglobales bacterium]